MDKTEYQVRLYTGIAMFVVTCIIGFFIQITDCNESTTEDGILFCNVLKDTTMIVMAGFLIASGLGAVFTIIVGYKKEFVSDKERTGCL